jgi:hypothetical protein
MSKASAFPKINQIFQDLDNYRNFCREYGYIFDENDLYSQRSYIYRQYQKHQSGKSVKNNWDAALARRA